MSCIRYIDFLLLSYTRPSAHARVFIYSNRGRSAVGRHPDQASGQPGAACAPLGEQAPPLTACFRFISGRGVEYGMSDQHLEKRQVPTPCTNTHTHVITHTHGRSQVPSFEITHTHTHRRGRQAGEMRRRGPNTIRRGEAGVESNHTSRGRPLPAQNHKSKSRRERVRNDRETGERREERGERRERGDTTQGSLPRENGQVWEGPRSCGPQTTHHHMIF